LSETLNEPSDAPDPRRDALRRIIAERSFKRGEDIKLASGRTSSFYFDMKATMLHPKGAALIAELMLDAAEAFSPDYIGGLEMGAVPIVCAASAASDRRARPLAAFFVRKSAKGHGTRALIEGLAPQEELAGKRVVIAEDVTTTGGSALKAVEVAEAEGATVVAILTIVDRLEGATEAIAAKGYPFRALFRADAFV
jgi:orotate phosphoribosyltransferase